MSIYIGLPSRYVKYVCAQGWIVFGKIEKMKNFDPAMASNVIEDTLVKAFMIFLNYLGRV
jgi:hypothetical protein